MAQSPECRDLGWLPWACLGLVGARAGMVGWTRAWEARFHLRQPIVLIAHGNPILVVECGRCFEMQRG